MFSGFNYKGDLSETDMNKPSVFYNDIHSTTDMSENDWHVLVFDFHNTDVVWIGFINTVLSQGILPICLLFLAALLNSFFHSRSPTS
ncbi:20714_t:CDS:2, partial [Racocetra persica]